MLWGFALEIVYSEGKPNSDPTMQRDHRRCSSVIFKLVEIESFLLKVLPIFRDAFNLRRSLLVPIKRLFKVLAIAFGIFAIMGAPDITFKSCIDTLRLIEEVIAASMSIRPFVEFIPISTHADLMIASILTSACRRVHWSIIGFTDDVLQ